MNDPERTPAPASASTRTGARRSSLGLMVLWQLVAEPMHVYRMQKLFEQQGKDRVVNVRARASLYQTLERLTRLGLVEVHETVRSEGYPERTVYAITEPAARSRGSGCGRCCATTGGEYPDFIAAVSILFGLAPEDARAQLELRAERLAPSSPRRRRNSPRTPRCRGCSCSRRSTGARSCRRAGWLRGVIADMRAGRLTWSEEWLKEIFSAFHPPTTQEEA